VVPKRLDDLTPDDVKNFPQMFKWFETNAFLLFVSVVLPSFRPKDLVLDDLDRDKFVRVVPPEELPKREVMLGQRAGRQNYWFHVSTARHEEVKIN
jgi:hypothetical protein